MRAHLTAAATAALLLGLVGCSAAPEKAPTEEPAASTEETTEVEPLTAEPVEEEATAGTPDEAYLAAVREALDPEKTQIPDASDEQLLAAGQAACEQLSADPDVFGVQVIDGEEPDNGGYFRDSLVIANAASATLCAG